MSVPSLVCRETGPRGPVAFALVSQMGSHKSRGWGGRPWVAFEWCREDPDWWSCVAIRLTAAECVAAAVAAMPAHPDRDAGAPARLERWCEARAR